MQIWIYFASKFTYSCWRSCLHLIPHQNQEFQWRLLPAAETCNWQRGCQVDAVFNWFSCRCECYHQSVSDIPFDIIMRSVAVVSPIQVTVFSELMGLKAFAITRSIQENSNAFRWLCALAPISIIFQGLNRILFSRVIVVAVENSPEICVICRLQISQFPGDTTRGCD